MLSAAKPELVCDFAEVYHVYDYRALPCEYAATLAAGLSDDSRTIKKMTGKKADTNTYLLAAIADRLSVIVWQRTKDGAKNKNRPQMFTDILTGKAAQRGAEKPMSFRTKQDLDKALARFRRNN